MCLSSLLQVESHWNLVTNLFNCKLYLSQFKEQNLNYRNFPLFTRQRKRSMCRNLTKNYWNKIPQLMWFKRSKVIWNSTIHKIVILMRIAMITCQTKVQTRFKELNSDISKDHFLPTAVTTTSTKQSQLLLHPFQTSQQTMTNSKVNLGQPKSRWRLCNISFL